MYMIPLNPINGTTPFTYPNWIRLEVAMAKNTNPYKFEPVLWPKTSWQNEGAKLNVAPIQELAKKTSSKNNPLSWIVNLIVENTNI